MREGGSNPPGRAEAFACGSRSRSRPRAPLGSGAFGSGPTGLAAPPLRIIAYEPQLAVKAID